MVASDVLARPRPAPAPFVADDEHDVTDPGPSLSFGGQPVDAAAHVHPGTSWRVMLGWVALLIGAVVIAASTMGVGLVALILGPIVAYFQAKKARMLIRGSGVHVAPDQLAFLHRMTTEFARRLGMREAPEVYVVESEMANGFAVRLGKKNVVLLTDDVVWGALQSKDPRALGFVVGHELAHVALGHTGTIRGMLRTMFRPLSRCDEHSCDAVAAALVGDKTVAVHGLTVLTVGPQLLRWLNEDALLRQAREVAADKLSLKAEKGLTHPLLLRRIAYVLGAR
jgi:Zn-dependent protease with chaperone function